MSNLRFTLLAAVLSLSCATGTRDFPAPYLEQSLFKEWQGTLTESQVQKLLDSRVRVVFPIRCGLVDIQKRMRMSGRRDMGVVRQEVVEKIEESLRDNPSISKVAVIPAQYVQGKDTFKAVRDIAARFQVDLVLLLSMETNQYMYNGIHTFSYITIVGAWLFPFTYLEEYCTLNASAFDVRTEVILFNATGNGMAKGHTPIALEESKGNQLTREAAEIALKKLVRQIRSSLRDLKAQGK